VSGVRSVDKQRGGVCDEITWWAVEERLNSVFYVRSQTVVSCRLLACGARVSSNVVRTSSLGHYMRLLREIHIPDITEAEATSVRQLHLAGLAITAMLRDDIMHVLMF